MPVTTIYAIEFVGSKWVARMGEAIFDRNQMLARIKAKTLKGLDVEEEWAAFCILERHAAEQRWKK